MSRTTLTTQSRETPPAPIIQRAYQWLIAQGETAQQYAVADADATAQEYELADTGYFAYQGYALAEVFTADPFKQLVDQWHEERGATSSITEMVLCPAYQSIIGMGPRAVPLILSQLESEGDDPDHWFWALQVLTLDNPVSDDDEGDLQAMALAWIRWGRCRYIW